MLPALALCVDAPLLMGTLPDVASERLPVLHIRLNLPQN
jgi:hypothetical protein